MQGCSHSVDTVVSFSHYGIAEVPPPLALDDSVCVPGMLPPPPALLITVCVCLACCPFSEAPRCSCSITSSLPAGHGCGFLPSSGGNGAAKTAFVPGGLFFLIVSLI